jgi:hypothetical protein
MSVGQYLQHYAEAEIQQITELDYYYENILTIPAFDEPESLISKLQQLITPSSVLIILVLNVPDNLHSPDTVYATQALGEKLKNVSRLLKQFSSNIHLLELSETPVRHLLLVERCHEGKCIPAAEGVGLARKIACDIACKIIAMGRINSPWIHTTDADVTLPKDYFRAKEVLNPEEVAVALYPFQHTVNPDPHVHLCQQIYDISLHYYVEGLSWANSPYAFHTIGSTLLINFHAYALARGFPKRAAAEDFYLLNKMAKTSEIVSLKEPVISIDSRMSARVPFGTGPALIKIADFNNPRLEYLYYNPLCFQYLKSWLEMLPELWKNKTDSLSLTLLQQILTNVNRNDKVIELEILLSCLQSLGLEKALKHAIQNSRSQESFIRHLHNWFDAFRTLKFIHLVRDSLATENQPSVPLATLLAEANFLTERLKSEIIKVNSD